MSYDACAEEACVNCGGEDIRLDPQRGEESCADCGACWPAPPCEAEERQNFAGDPDRRRTTEFSRIEQLLGELTYGPKIVGKGENARRLQRAQQQIMQSDRRALQKNLEAIFKNLSMCADLMNLSSVVVEDAKGLYMKFDKAIKGPKKGLRTIEFTLALIYLASKARTNEAKTLREIVFLNYSKDWKIVGKAPVEKTIRKFIRTISQAIPTETGKILEPGDFLDQIVEYLSMPWTVGNVARDILENDSMKCLSGKRSSTIAAVAIFLASQKEQIEYSGDDLLADIALFASIGPETLKNALKEVEGATVTAAAEPPPKKMKY
jgi:transcription initiation factor TFIIIB Brf1 subunit/transcription initiation factor TFIIB